MPLRPARPLPAFRLCVAATLAALAAPAAGAQKVGVESLADLAFPTIVWGETLRIEPSGAGAASFRVARLRGKPTPQVRLTFGPAPVLQTSGGSTLAVTFGPSSAAWADNNGGPLTAFDPRQSLTVTLPGDGDLYVWLGGTAAPTSAQSPGSYAGTVTLSVADF